MMRILFFLLLAIGTVKAQEADTVVMGTISRVDVIYETAQAIISLSKKDILSDYEDFNKGFYTPEEEEKKAYGKAVAYLKKSKKPVRIEAEKKYDEPELSVLAKFMKIRSVASLINSKKAIIVRKLDNQKQESILVRPLVSSMEGSAYLFMFMNSARFFQGEVYGEVIVYLEEVK